jgi:hypothetical protein
MILDHGSAGTIILDEHNGHALLVVHAFSGCPYAVPCACKFESL